MTLVTCYIVTKGRHTEEAPAIRLNVKIVMSIRPLPTSPRPRDGEIWLVRPWVVGEAHVAVDAIDDILDRKFRDGRVFVTDYLG